MPDPQDMVMPLLGEMRPEIAGCLDAVDRRLATLVSGQISFRQARAGDSLMSKRVTGDFEERLEWLETRVRELEIPK